MRQGSIMPRVLIEGKNRDWEAHFECKAPIFFRQDYGSRIYLRQTYLSIPLSIHRFRRSVTGKRRQTYGSRRGNLMGLVTITYGNLQKQLRKYNFEDVI